MFRSETVVTIRRYPASLIGMIRYQ
jgi:hypothetical protein